MCCSVLNKECRCGFRFGQFQCLKSLQHRLATIPGLNSLANPQMIAESGRFSRLEPYRRPFLPAWREEHHATLTIWPAVCHAYCERYN